MKTPSQEYKGLEELRAEVEAVKKKQDEIVIKRERDRPRIVKTNPLFSVIPLIIGIFLAILLHLYYQPFGFSERLVTSVVMLIVIAGGSWLSIAIYDKIK
jgi:hypothetical protein